LQIFLLFELKRKFKAFYEIRVEVISYNFGPVDFFSVVCGVILFVDFDKGIGFAESVHIFELSAADEKLDFC